MAMSSRERKGLLARLSLRARLAIAALLWCGVAVSVTAVVLIGLFRDHLSREADAEIRDLVVELVAQTRVARDGSVRLAGDLPGTRFRRPFSGWGWQIRRRETVLAQSASLGPVTAEALAAPLGTAGLFQDARGRRLRGLARAVAPRFHTERLTFVVARPQDEIDRAATQFGRAVLVALGVLGAGLVGTAVAALAIGLRPLAKLGQDIARMRAGHVPPERAWPAEIAPIAREIEALRVHTERLVCRGKGLAADLAHAIKTPLTVIRQHAEGLGPEDRTVLRRQAERIGHSLERHLGRSGVGGAPYVRVDPCLCVEDLIQALERPSRDRGLEIAREVTPRALFLGDEADLYEMVGNLLDNAVKWATTRVMVSVAMAEGRLRIEIADDGPGIPEAERAAILERGKRLDEAMPGHGLGLAILADLVDGYGGELRLAECGMGGLSAVLLLPGVLEQPSATIG